MACEDDRFDAVIDAGEAEEVFELVCHDVREGIVVVRSVESANEDWGWSWRRGRMVGNADFGVGEGLVGGGEFGGDWLAG